MRTIRRVAVTAAVAVGIGSIAGGFASPAQARIAPECTGYTRWDGIWGGQYTAWYPTRGMGTYDTRCSLEPGDSGRAVRLLQQVLNYCYGAGLAEDGKYGRLTGDAMQRVWREEFSEADHNRYYSDFVRRRMDWKNWRYDDRGGHPTCKDNG